METAEETRVDIEPIVEGNAAGESAQQGNDEQKPYGPEPEVKRRVSKPTSRIVLARDTSDTDGYAIVGTFEGTEKEAKRQAIESNENVRECYRQGHLALVAPPARGWNETEPKPDEVMRGL